MKIPIKEQKALFSNVADMYMALYLKECKLDNPNTFNMERYLAAYNVFKAHLDGINQQLENEKK